MRVSLLFIILLFSGNVFSQVSDFIVVKKRNNRTLKTYFPGVPISYETLFGNNISGTVEAIRNDSVFVKQYDVRGVPTSWGVVKIDTLTTYITGIHYKDIQQMLFERRESFAFIKRGTVFIIGGFGYAALNLINGKYLHESITGRANRKSLIIASGVAGGGLLLNQLYRYGHRNRNYRVEYVRMNRPARPF